MTFATSREQYFPSSLTETEYVKRSFDLLSGLGFSAENTLPCIGHCRDELTVPLVNMLQAKWGNAFSFASLGGLYTPAKTGLIAAIQHAPTTFERERYLFFQFTHIGINEAGELGNIRRPDQTKDSAACGALIAFQHHLEQGETQFDYDETDPEQSLLRQRLWRYGLEPTIDLASLTVLALDAARSDLELAIAAVIDTAKSDYAVLTGVHIHGLHGDWIRPKATYAMLNGVRHELKVS